MHHILIVDDDPTNCKLLKFLLEDEGYQVTTKRSGLEALNALNADAYDLVVLDVMMPGMNGLELCERIRETSTIPIIFISARNEIPDKVQGLKVGGDDYIIKPFDPNEVIARVWAALRRHRHTVNSESNLRTSDLVLDPIENDVTLIRTGKKVSLTPVEARLLRCLVSNAGRSLTRETLIIKVWGYEYEGNSNQLDVYIKRLRSKIEQVPSEPRMLLTIRGVGYKFQPTEAGAATSGVVRG